MDNKAKSRVLFGKALKDTSFNTVTILVTRFVRHKCGKTLRKHTKYIAHDPNNMVKKGDKVKISMHRPFSKTKSWLVEIEEQMP
jgi:small subunit ribosomal protein S17